MSAWLGDGSAGCSADGWADLVGASSADWDRAAPVDDCSVDGRSCRTAGGSPTAARRCVRRRRSPPGRPSDGRLPGRSTKRRCPAASRSASPANCRSYCTDWTRWCSPCWTYYLTNCCSGCSGSVAPATRRPPPESPHSTPPRSDCSDCAWASAANSDWSDPAARTSEWRPPRCSGCYWRRNWMSYCRSDSAGCCRCLSCLYFDLLMIGWFGEGFCRFLISSLISSFEKGRIDGKIQRERERNWLIFSFWGNKRDHWETDKINFKLPFEVN